MFIVDQQQALSFLVNQVSYIEPQVYEVQYPDIQYQDLIPVDTAANEWAKSVTFYSVDRVGQAQWYNHLAKDIPHADIERTQFQRGIEMAAIGYGYTLEEIGQAMMIPGTNLATDKANAARRASEEFIETRAFLGDSDKGWTGIANAPNVTFGNAPNGAGGSPLWSQKTALEIVADINSVLSGVWTDSNTVEVADTVLIPFTRWQYLTTAVVANTNMTAMQFLQANNSYTARTGNPLTVRSVVGLETSGAGGTARMIGYRRDPGVVKLHMPMPHRFLPVWQTGPMQFDVPGIFRFGGVDVRRPGAMRYLDGI